jgi:hypothetical protein
MTDPPSMTMTLFMGLRVDDLLAAERLVARALDLHLRMAEDGELGGAYFVREPAQLPAEGLGTVRVRTNPSPGRTSVLPNRPDLPYFAQIGVVGTNLLELGRIARALEVEGGAAVSAIGYDVGARRPGSAGRSLWRAHSVRFPSDEAALPAGHLGPREAPTGTPSRWPAVPVWGDGADDQPRDLLCQLTLGFSTQDTLEAQARATELLGVELTPRDSHEMGGRYLTWSRAAGPGLTRALVRSNALKASTFLYPARKEHALLLDITLVTPNLLDPGRITATAESKDGRPLSPIAYHVVGDLVRDRVIRSLEREFGSAKEAAPRWHPGHEPADPDDDGDDPGDAPEEEEDHP